MTITRSTSAVPDACNGEEFWAGAIETDKNATPRLAAKATLTELGLARGFILKPEGPTKCDYMFGVKILQAKSPRKKAADFSKLTAPNHRWPSTKNSNFPRYIWPDFLQYLCERKNKPTKN
ncbi:MAG: hypothetical protein AUI05_03250 [Verrucomicrobia bacterium 13_2_20CM_2_54_15_9cls]|nr:MAG: hypothetical protein AUI05_03250 [Verrucomicrobia bacterium 13_2_20CM_2_54_15_9cls]